LTDLQMSQGPAGAFAWCKADEGIYYITKKGLYLFDGNGASQNICLSDGRVKKIFEEDIDWGSCTDMQTGEIIGVIMAWDKGNRCVLISYPKKGEQGVGTGIVPNHDLPDGTPTRMMVYDTYGRRFTEYIYPLPIDDDYRNPCPGIMLSGQDPTDDDYTMITHPIGNALGANADGRLLFHANTGYRDNVTLDGTATPELLSGDRITYDATSKDNTLGVLKPKLTVMQQRQIIYANNGTIKRKVIYNYYDVNDEVELTFGATADGWYSEKTLIHQVVHTGTDSVLAIVAMKYYHDDPLHTKLRITCNTGGAPMTATPAIGATITQAVTGASLTVTQVDLVNFYIYGDDLGTGAWDTVVPIATITDGVGGTLAPDPCTPSVVDLAVLNIFNTNPDLEPIQFVAVSLEVVSMGGDTKSSD